MTLYMESVEDCRLIISPMFLFAKTLRTSMTLRLKGTADAILLRQFQCKKRDI